MPHLGDAHQARHNAIDVGTAIGQGLLVAVLVVCLQRLVQSLELQRCLFLGQLCSSRGGLEGPALLSRMSVETRMPCRGHPLTDKGVTHTFRL